MVAFVLIRTELTIADMQGVNQYQDFLLSAGGMVLFDATCMRLQTIGETMKKVDAITNGKLLVYYPETPWRKVIGLRNIILHEYLALDPESIFATVKDELSPLLITLHRLKNELEDGRHDALF